MKNIEKQNLKIEKRLLALALDYAKVPHEKICKILSIRNGSVEKYKLDNYFEGFAKDLSYDFLDSIRANFIYNFIKPSDKLTKINILKVNEFLRRLQSEASYRITKEIVRKARKLQRR